MAPSLDELVFYGVRDITIAGESAQERAIRLFVMFPSLDGAVWSAPILEGSYPLILFVHGNRTGTEFEGLCPPEISGDYTLWWTVLHLLARAGFVVACPDVSAVISADPATTTPVLERVLAYMYGEWEHSPMLRSPERGGRLGIAGHSWGANAGLAQMITANGSALAAIAGTWETGAQANFGSLTAPILLISGTVDDLLANAANQPYTPRNPPKHQVALAATGHWAWFRPGEIYPCSREQPYDCSAGAHILMETLAAFFTRYLYDDATIVPFLLEDPGNPPNRQRLDYLKGGSCAARIRFDTGVAVSGFLSWIARLLTPNNFSWGSLPWTWRLLGRFVRTDTVTVGNWTEGPPWN